jgi:hypothetical protein
MPTARQAAATQPQPTTQLLGLLDYMEERENARFRRSMGEPYPWSSEPTIASKFLCNVHRDDDRQSREARAIVMDAPEARREVLIAAFRWCNKASTLEALRADGLGLDTPASRIEGLLRSLDKPLGTAYKINPPGGLWNLGGVAGQMVRSIAAVADLRRSLYADKRSSARLVTQHLISRTRAPFVAFQTMLDLRWVWGAYEDDHRWTYIGPGAMRGLRRYIGEYQAFGRTREGVSAGGNATVKVDSELWLADRAMLDLFHRVHLQVAERFTGMDAHEVEHNLCEWDKYCRMATGESAGRSFRR